MSLNEKLCMLHVALTFTEEGSLQNMVFSSYSLF